MRLNYVDIVADLVSHDPDFKFENFTGWVEYIGVGPFSSAKVRLDKGKRIRNGLQIVWIDNYRLYAINGKEYPESLYWPMIYEEYKGTGSKEESEALSYMLSGSGSGK